MPHLNLSADEVLSTTRAVRKRLDLRRPVAREVLKECLELAIQAPTGRNRQRWDFIVVTDPEQRRALAEVYWHGPRDPLALSASHLPGANFTRARVGEHITSKTYEGLHYLLEHLHEVPALVIPCIRGRTENASILEQANTWGSILPAVWSFMLAARERGLGTAWTTLSPFCEREVAELLGIPHEEIMQAALIPVAYTIGSDFRPGPRVPLAQVVHWERW
ncbi:nitroreductase [Ktedonosporobacter rubrisoli]|uniref:Nitroreductase n=1 Tax=Ktedonosporobacter rubrisoli TaxID=2509675 RepID=A0A4P6JJQ2_KTERU|nr:nitroreductase family protein [Ktedonosporobacter rubrisoli]QBD75348.1 nitroreductase [Ktedonosporobacter rubrisoli]